MKTWLKAILSGVAGAIIGAVLGIMGMLVWIFLVSPPHFKNDSEAMGFPILLITFGIVAASEGALVGAIASLALVWWRTASSKRRILES